MKKCRPQNVVFVACCIVVPWRFTNTYYTMANTQLWVSRYYAQKGKSMFVRKIDCIELNKVVKISFPKAGDSLSVEATKQSVYGKYMSQELVFALSDGSTIGWNVRPYTKKQVKKLLNELMAEYELEVDENLKRALG